MRDSNQGRKFGRRNFDSRGGGSHGRGAAQRAGRPSMHRAVCSSCKMTCEVPFRPTGDKPVYCRECFEKVDGGSGPRKSGGKDFGKSNFERKQMFPATCDECGKSCEVPFRPTAGKPIYCNQCFGKVENAGSKAPNALNEQYKQQFEILNTKLDKILKLLATEVKVPMKSEELTIEEVTKTSKADKPRRESKPKKPKAKKKTL